MNEEELYGYLAGFFDGDGSIYQNSRTGRWYVNVSNTVLASLDRFVDTFGGSIHKREAKGKRKALYQWYVSGEIGMRFCRAILPYLVIKGPKVERAIKDNFGLKTWPPIPIDRAAIARRNTLAARKRAKLQERQHRAFELHEQGKSYRKIMNILGYRSSAGAFDAVKAGEQGQESEHTIRE